MAELDVEYIKLLGSLQTAVENISKKLDGIDTRITAIQEHINQYDGILRDVRAEYDKKIWEIEKRLEKLESDAKAQIIRKNNFWKTLKELPRLFTATIAALLVVSGWLVEHILSKAH